MEKDVDSIIFKKLTKTAEEFFNIDYSQSKLLNKIKKIPSKINGSVKSKDAEENIQEDYFVLRKIKTKEEQQKLEYNHKKIINENKKLDKVLFKTNKSIFEVNKPINSEFFSQICDERETPIKAKYQYYNKSKNEIENFLNKYIIQNDNNDLILSKNSEILDIHNKSKNSYHLSLDNKADTKSNNLDKSKNLILSRTSISNKLNTVKNDVLKESRQLNFMNIFSKNRSTKSNKEENRLINKSPTNTLNKIQKIDLSETMLFQEKNIKTDRDDTSFFKINYLENTGINNFQLRKNSFFAGLNNNKFSLLRSNVDNKISKKSINFKNDKNRFFIGLNQKEVPEAREYLSISMNKNIFAENDKSPNLNNEIKIIRPNNLKIQNSLKTNNIDELINKRRATVFNTLNRNNFQFQNLLNRENVKFDAVKKVNFFQADASAKDTLILKFNKKNSPKNILSLKQYNDHPRINEPNVSLNNINKLEPDELDKEIFDIHMNPKISNNDFKRSSFTLNQKFLDVPNVQNKHINNFQSSKNIETLNFFKYVDNIKNDRVNTSIAEKSGEESEISQNKKSKNSNPDHELSVQYKNELLQNEIINSDGNLLSQNRNLKPYSNIQDPRNNNSNIDFYNDVNYYNDWNTQNQLLTNIIRKDVKNKKAIKKKKPQSKYSNIISFPKSIKSQNNIPKGLDDSDENRSIKNFNNIYDSFSEEEIDETLFKRPWFIMSPDSSIRNLLDTICSILIMYSIIVSPYQMAFDNETSLQKDTLFYIDFFIDIFFILDLILNFFTAFKDEKDEAIYKFKRILFHYVKFWFILDLISSIPFTMINYILDLNETANPIINFNNSNSGGKIDTMVKLQNFAKLGRLYRILKWTRVFRIFKMTKTGRNLNPIKNLDSLSNSMNRFLQFLLLFTILTHITACLWCFIGKTMITSGDINNWIHNTKLDDFGNIHIYIASVYFILSTIFSIGYGDITSKFFFERLFVVFLMTIGCFLYSFFLTSLSNIIGKLDQKYEIYNKKEIILNDIKKEYKLGHKLYSKIRKSLKHDLIHWNYDKFTLLDTLPTILKNQLYMKMYERKIVDLIFFSNKSYDFITAAVSLLKSAKFFKNDYIISLGELVDEMYMTTYGVIALQLGPQYLKFELCNIRKGYHFGDILMYTNEQSQLNYKVKSLYAHIFMLSKVNFAQLKLNFKEEINKVLEYSYAYFTRIEKITSLAIQYYDEYGTFADFRFYVKKIINNHEEISDSEEHDKSLILPDNRNDINNKAYECLYNNAINHIIPIEKENAECFKKIPASKNYNFEKNLFHYSIDDNFSAEGLKNNTCKGDKNLLKESDNDDQEVIKKQNDSINNKKTQQTYASKDKNNLSDRNMNFQSIRDKKFNDIHNSNHEIKRKSSVDIPRIGNFSIVSKGENSSSTLNTKYSTSFRKLIDFKSDPKSKENLNELKEKLKLNYQEEMKAHLRICQELKLKLEAINSLFKDETANLNKGSDNLKDIIYVETENKAENLINDYDSRESPCFKPIKNSANSFGKNKAKKKYISDDIFSSHKNSKKDINNPKIKNLTVSPKKSFREDFFDISQYYDFKLKSFDFFKKKGILNDEICKAYDIKEGSFKLKNYTRSEINQSNKKHQQTTGWEKKYKNYKISPPHKIKNNKNAISNYNNININKKKNKIIYIKNLNIHCNDKRIHKLKKQQKNDSNLDLSHYFNYLDKTCSSNILNMSNITNSVINDLNKLKKFPSIEKLRQIIPFANQSNKHKESSDISFLSTNEKNNKSINKENIIIEKLNKNLYSHQIYKKISTTRQNDNFDKIMDIQKADDSVNIITDNSFKHQSFNKNKNEKHSKFYIHKNFNEKNEPSEMNDQIRDRKENQAYVFPKENTSNELMKNFNIKETSERYLKKIFEPKSENSLDYKVLSYADKCKSRNSEANIKNEGENSGRMMYENSINDKKQPINKAAKTSINILKKGLSPQKTILANNSKIMPINSLFLKQNSKKTFLPTSKKSFTGKKSMFLLPPTENSDRTDFKNNKRNKKEFIKDLSNKISYDAFLYSNQEVLQMCIKDFLDEIGGESRNKDLLIRLNNIEKSLKEILVIKQNNKHTRDGLKIESPVKLNKIVSQKLNLKNK